MHFAAWLSVGDSVKDPAGYYRNNVGGTLSVLDAMATTGVQHFVFSSTCAVFGNPDDDADPRGHPEASDQRLRRDEAGDRARAAALRDAPTASASIALRYFNAAGADPDGELGEDHAPEIHVIPRAIDAAMGRGSFQIFGDDYPTPDGTCLRDYVHVTDLAVGAPAGARRAARRRARRTPTTSATAGRHRCARSSTRSSA